MGSARTHGEWRAAARPVGCQAVTRPARRRRCREGTGCTRGAWSLPCLAAREERSDLDSTRRRRPLHLDAQKIFFPPLHPSAGRPPAVRRPCAGWSSAVRRTVYVHFRAHVGPRGGVAWPSVAPQTSAGRGQGVRRTPGGRVDGYATRTAHIPRYALHAALRVRGTDTLHFACRHSALARWCCAPQVSSCAPTPSTQALALQPERTKEGWS